MSFAGQQLLAGRIPGEEIEAEVTQADSGTFTDETVVMTMVFSAVADRTYRTWFDGAFTGTAGDRVLVRIREDDLTGNELQQRNVDIMDGSGLGWGRSVSGRYTALSTVSKTVVVTAQLSSGTGPIALEAGSARPAVLKANYIRG